MKHIYCLIFHNNILYKYLVALQMCSIDLHIVLEFNENNVSDDVWEIMYRAIRDNVDCDIRIGTDSFETETSFETSLTLYFDGKCPRNIESKITDAVEKELECHAYIDEFGPNYCINSEIEYESDSDPELDPEPELDPDLDPEPEPEPDKNN